MRNKFVCIHGHFYQPPRENPWIEEVEIEDSASPYHDWNERIFQECYGPNGASPLLDGHGRILRFVNNYEHISFNFGPTLLNWMERRHSDLYARIIEADHRSREARGGHGNALAQAYNHMILPLASRRDKATQVRWGLEDFRTRFHREPEGMWLPETAVDDETLEALIAKGLRFTVLSPLQAARVRPLNTGDSPWQEVGDAILTTRAYRWLSKETPGRHIDVFFYDRGISQAVAFERILDSGDAFAGRIYSAFGVNDAVELAAAATDGESYGHHHRFGNMALSYAIQELTEGAGARLTNFGEFLDIVPPIEEVKLRPRTAWSCSHGLGRWSDDCGCGTGAHPAWRQTWRAPLREALDDLAAALDAFYVDRSKGLLRDPWAAREDYIRCVLDPTSLSMQHFLDQHAPRHLTLAETTTALELCELQLHRMLMYTSCGWFFDDISGIESAQILKYAARAVELAARLGCPAVDGVPLNERFRQALTRCPSNVSQYPDGAAVYSRLVLPLAVDLPRAAAHFAIQEHLQALIAPSILQQDSKNAKQDARLLEKRPACAGFEARGTQQRHETRLDGADERRLSVGWLRLRRRATLEDLNALVAVHHRGRTDIECRILPLNDPEKAGAICERLAGAFLEHNEEEFLRQLGETFPAQHYTLDALFADERRQALTLLLPRGNPELRDLLAAWRAEIIRLKLDPEAPPEEAARRLLALVHSGERADSVPEVQVLRQRVIDAFRRLAARPSGPSLRQAAAVLSAVWETGLHLSIWELQYLYGAWRQKQDPGGLDAAALDARNDIDRLLKFAPDKARPRESATERAMGNG